VGLGFFSAYGLKNAKRRVWIKEIIRLSIKSGLSSSKLPHSRQLVLSGYQKTKRTFPAASGRVSGWFLDVLPLKGNRPFIIPPVSRRAFKFKKNDAQHRVIKTPAHRSTEQFKIPDNHRKTKYAIFRAD